MDTQTRGRPNLQPIWTNYQNLSGQPQTAFRITRSPQYEYITSAVSPSSPRILPSPMHPSSAGYDPAMRQHERSLVERFDQRTPTQQSVGHFLPPIAEQTAHLGQVSLASPATPTAANPMMSPAGTGTGTGTGGRTPLSPRRPVQVRDGRKQSLAAETRSMLLSGMPRGQIGDLGTPVERHQSFQHIPSLATPLSSASPSSARRNSQVAREELQAWGHVYFGNGTSADCFVSAVALRRPSAASDAGKSVSAAPAAAGEGSGDDGVKSRDDSSSRRGNEDPPKSSQLTVRARVRPRALERKAFLLQRNFDLDELRSTIPDPSPTTPTSPAASRRVSANVVGAGGGRSISSYRRQRAQSLSSSAASAARRATLAVGHRLPSSDGLSLDHSKGVTRGGLITVPMHLQYARLHLPVLAALMLSGHIRQGDIIDLPMPHPEVWPQTVAYIYTGQGELSDAMKQNILYLGGKV